MGRDWIKDASDDNVVMITLSYLSSLSSVVVVPTSVEERERGKWL